MSKKSGIARYYDAKKNPGWLFFAGVPLDEISEEEYAAYPDWLKGSIDNCPWYTKTKPDTDVPEPTEQGEKEVEHNG